MTTEAIIEILRRACTERKVCKLHKKGEPEDRIVNPHGVHHSKNKDLVLVCIQVSGYSKSKNRSLYRNLAIQDFESVEMLSRTFTIDKDFNPDDDQYGEWLFHVLE
ncbi:hypothetical protein KK083_30945 [Fulvivirgaceae bacterium PWU4]|uniref:WYL domain-containing protein n=1 Tax=Chryseosolibacter histidini TaxID=2782349 RepID=A0AAP2DRU5_9BACT|nr:WYL domain-containing protein [Chryseosolibacter histidini]MBT1701351.1 hypothetical protein [Chryseosolibacter histidini]